MKKEVKVIPIKRKAVKKVTPIKRKTAKKKTAKKTVKKTKRTKIYTNKILVDKKTGLAHAPNCPLAKKILSNNLKVFDSERDAMKDYHPHKCLLP